MILKFCRSFMYLDGIEQYHTDIHNRQHNEGSQYLPFHWSASCTYSENMQDTLARWRSQVQACLRSRISLQALITLSCAGAAAIIMVIIIETRSSHQEAGEGTRVGWLPLIIHIILASKWHILVREKQDTTRGVVNARYNTYELIEKTNTMTQTWKHRYEGTKMKKQTWKTVKQQHEHIVSYRSQAANGRQRLFISRYSGVGRSGSNGMKNIGTVPNLSP